MRDREQGKERVFVSEDMCVLEWNEEGKRNKGKSDLQRTCA